MNSQYFRKSCRRSTRRRRAWSGWIFRGAHNSIRAKRGSAAMKTNQFVILGILLATTLAAADDKPTLSQSPMSPDQIEVYRAFLSSYTNGSKSPYLNLAKRTDAL